MQEKKLYLLPGRGEKLDGRLGSIILSTGYAIQGRQIISSFEQLWHQEQLELIRADLEKEFWHRYATIVGRSYGAYLLLQTLAELNPFPGKILLFSPVLGPAYDQQCLYIVSRPPRAERLYQLAKSHKFPAPKYMEIHTGAADQGCDVFLTERFATLVENTKLHIVAGAGHWLSQDYVHKVLTNFLGLAPQD